MKNKQTSKQTNKQTKKTNKQTLKQRSKQRNKEANKETKKQTKKQTSKHANKSLFRAKKWKIYLIRKNYLSHEFINSRFKRIRQKKELYDKETDLSFISVMMT